MRALCRHLRIRPCRPCFPLREYSPRDDEEVTVFQSAEERERQRRTDAFVAQLLAKDSSLQDSLDMVQAAVRLQTLREHHLLALIRGAESRWDTPRANAERSLRVIKLVESAGDCEERSVTPKVVNRTLQLLLRPVLKPTTAGGDAATSDLDLVWPFCAWMERRGFHIEGDAVFDALEKIAGNGSTTEDDILTNRMKFLRKARTSSPRNQSPRPSRHLA